MNKLADVRKDGQRGAVRDGLPFVRWDIGVRLNGAVRWILATIFVVSAVSWPGAAQDRVVPESFDHVRLSYAPTVRATAPAVVNIYAQRTVRARPILPFMDDPFFGQFFDERLFGMPRERVQNSLGSGVVIQADGLIVTNHHVIENSDEITVALSDRREFDATVVGVDESSDLAVLNIETNGEILPYLELANSDELEVGDLVLAIGNPFGVGKTVTSGIISALARTGVGVSDVASFIQTDAAINPGNSGGALVTSDGKLVGINTAIFSRSGGSIGIGFAIPSNLVRVVVAGIAAGGRPTRPWLGIESQPVTQDIADSIGLVRPLGVLVNWIHAKSPVRSAGLEVGDVVLLVDGREIFDPQGLSYRVATRGIGGTVTLTVRRRGEDITVDVPLIAPPEDPPRDVRVLTGTQPLAGATVGNLSPAFAQELDLDMDSSGVITLKVESGYAAQIGLKPGDVIMRIDGVEIDTTATLAEVLSQPAEQWEVVILRDGRERSVVVRI